MPALVAALFFPGRRVQAALVMLATLAIDLDHLLAHPVYDPLRCSMGFHPLHRFPALLLYGAMLAWPKTRLVGLGLAIHVALDAIDCLGMPGGEQALRDLLPF